ncbi:MAG TPA: hypothetical protein VJV05_08055 [Pyrinomonadaceae bacterium]|nr:hypothetical protein [Pyrinomonadaceae bacterium]
MDEIFHIEHRGDHIRVEIGPDAQVDEHWQTEYWSQLQAACKEFDTSRVLVEGYQPKGERSSEEVIEAGQRTAKVPHLWLAFCLKDWEPTAQSELYEAVAASRGVRVKFFSDRELALNWLRTNAPK